MKMAKWILFAIFSAAVHLHAIPWMFPETLLTRESPSMIVSKIDSNGDAIAVWVTEGEGEPQFSLYEAASQSWTAPSTLDRTEHPPANKAVPPALCVGESGQAIVFWAYGGKLVARVLSAETWEPALEEVPLVISTESTTNISAIFADMNISGDAAIVWSETRQNPVRDVAMVRRYVHGTWEPPLAEKPYSLYDDLVTDTIEVSPSIRINDAGDLAVAWKFHDSVVARRFDSQTNEWIPSLEQFPFCLSASRAYFPRVAIDLSGDFYAAWIREDAIEAVRTVDGILQPVENLGGANGAPDIIAHDGTAIVVWPSLGDMIYTSVFSEGSWSLPMMISQIGATYPAVAIDASGNGIAVWENRATGTVQMADFHHKVWQTPVDLFPIGDEPRFAGVALSRSGNTLISWKTKVGTGEAAVCLKNPIAISHGEPLLTFGDPPPSPASIAGKRVRNHFGLVSEIFHEITWEASPSENVVGYQIFVYNRLVKEVPRNTTLFRDHNKDRGPSVPYQVRAIDADGLQSHPLTIMID